ncbi:MAG: MarR family transcriptional regulator [Candidatus Eisenbacteria bacterium]
MADNRDMERRTIAEEIKSRPMPAEQAAVRHGLRTADLRTAEMRMLLKEHGITRQQYNVLRILRGAGPDGLPTLEVGTRMVTRVPDVTRLVDRMVAADLVRRTRSDTDRRVVRTTLTPKGIEIVDSLLQPVTELHRQQLLHLSEEELTELSRLLEKARAREELPQSSDSEIN